MARLHADRIWLAGGAVAAALLAVLGWFIAIHPKNVAAAGLNDQTVTTEIRLQALRRRLAELQEQKARLPEYQAALTRNQEALPADTGMPAFLRQLQGSEGETGVKVTGLNVGAPAAAKDLTAVYTMPLTVNAEGNATSIGRFLDELQQVQPRAVLVDSANLTPGSGGKDSMSLILTMKAFVAPSLTPAPTPTR
jgi:type IV pilus assembly protein PilO